MRETEGGQPIPQPLGEAAVLFLREPAAEVAYRLQTEQQLRRKRRPLLHPLHFDCLPAILVKTRVVVLVILVVRLQDIFGRHLPSDDSLDRSEKIGHCCGTHCDRCERVLGAAFDLHRE